MTLAGRKARFGTHQPSLLQNDRRGPKRPGINCRRRDADSGWNRQPASQPAPTRPVTNGKETRLGWEWGGGGRRCKPFGRPPLFLLGPFPGAKKLLPPSGTGEFGIKMCPPAFYPLLPHPPLPGAWRLLLFPPAWRSEGSAALLAVPALTLQLFHGAPCLSRAPGRCCSNTATSQPLTSPASIGFPAQGGGRGGRRGSARSADGPD